MRCILQLIIRKIKAIKPKMRFFEFFQKVSMTKFVKKIYFQSSLFKKIVCLVDGSVDHQLCRLLRRPKAIACENFGGIIVGKYWPSIAVRRLLETLDLASGVSVFFFSSVFLRMIPAIPDCIIIIFAPAGIIQIEPVLGLGSLARSFFFVTADLFSQCAICRYLRDLWISSFEYFEGADHGDPDPSAIDQQRRQIDI